jgi:membrane associated rhomboid family serine protease
MDDPRTGGPAGDGGSPKPLTRHERELEAALSTQGPLRPEIARELIDRGRERLELGEPLLAATDFRRVIGHDDPALTGAAWLGLGEALYRLDAEGQAREAWEAAVRLRENPSTYRAWRNLAGVRVREGDLRGAIDAYRQADRRAPAEDKAEIAARLGWLSKETGNEGAAGRYFARSRGGVALGLTHLILAITVVVSFLAFSDLDLLEALWLDRSAVDSGELYRLLSVALVHAPGDQTPWFSLHLFFNMYALYIVGPIVEAAWGRRLFGLFYVLAALTASTASILFSPGPSVGASGAIFGLVGVALAGTRAHHPVLDRRSRAIVPQLGFFVIINLAFGFLAGGMIDNAAHIGGLLAGLWLGFLVPPGKVPTLQSAWQHPRGEGAERSPILIAAGVVGLLGVVLVGLFEAGVWA